MKQAVLSLLLSTTSMVQAIEPVLLAQAASHGTSHCKPGDIVLPDGTCQSCAAGFQPDAYSVICIPQHKCQMAVGQINNPNGSCSPCNNCQVPNSTFTQCVPDQKSLQCLPKCPANQFQSNSGCQSCPACEQQDTTGLKCIPYTQPSYGQCLGQIPPKSGPIVCNWTSEIVDTNGQCIPCGKCTKPNWNHTKCLEDANYQTCMSPGTTQCPANQVKSTPTGPCQVCPPGWQANAQQTTCTPTSAPTWIPAPAPTYIPAPAPTYIPAPAPTPQVCTGNQIRSTQYGCVNCAAGSAPDSTGSVCRSTAPPVAPTPPPVQYVATPPPVQYVAPPPAPTCASNQVRNSDGSCYTCQGNSYPSPDNTYCTVVQQQPAPPPQYVSPVVSTPTSYPTYQPTQSTYQPTYPTQSTYSTQSTYQPTYSTQQTYQPTYQPSYSTQSTYQPSYSSPPATQQPSYSSYPSTQSASNYNSPSQTSSQSYVPGGNYWLFAKENEGAEEESVAETTQEESP